MRKIIILSFCFAAVNMSMAADAVLSSSEGFVSVKKWAMTIAHKGETNKSEIAKQVKKSGSSPEVSVYQFHIADDIRRRQESFVLFLPERISLTVNSGEVLDASVKLTDEDGKQLQPAGYPYISAGVLGYLMALRDLPGARQSIVSSRFGTYMQESTSVSLGHLTIEASTNIVLDWRKQIELRGAESLTNLIWNYRGQDERGKIAIAFAPKASTINNGMLAFRRCGEKEVRVFDVPEKARFGEDDRPYTADGVCLTFEELDFPQRVETTKEGLEDARRLFLEDEKIVEHKEK